MPLKELLDLIADVQTTTRSEAILSSYCPSIDAPPLTSLRDAISRLGLPTEYLRCQHCNGALLNGVGSVPCVFCGTVPITRPDSIYFSSTIACGWFLDSLDLNGSEAFRPSNEDGTQASWGEMFSKLVELKIKWTALTGTSINHEKLFGALDIEGAGRSLNESYSGSLCQQEDGWEADFMFAGAPDCVQSQHQGVLKSNAAELHIFPDPHLHTIDSDQLDMVFGSVGKINGSSKATTSVDFGKDGHDSMMISSSKKHDLVNNDARLVLSDVEWFEGGQLDNVSKDNIDMNSGVDGFSSRSNVDADAEEFAADTTNWVTGPTDDDFDTIMSQMHDLSFMLQPKLSLPH